MKTRQYSVLALLISLLCFWMEFPSVLGVQCYVCYSTKSWDDCNRNILSMNCSEVSPRGMQFDVCQKWSYASLDEDGKKVDHYLKSCGLSKHCGWDECECPMQCCSTDHCNGAATVFEVSRIMLAICALRQFVL